MKRHICAAAIAAPLLMSCDKKDAETAVDQPDRTTEVSPDTVMAGPRMWTAQQMQANERRLKTFVKSRVGEARAAATSWDAVLDKDWPIKYLHCKEPDGTPVDDSKCHLYVDETKTPPTPVRHIRIGRISATEYWAIVRSKDNPNEFMYCGKLEQKDLGTPSYIKGDCTIWPHDTNDPIHLVDMNLMESSLGTYTSIFFEFSDDDSTTTSEPVHNGDAHGGDD
jgi:hypothetical protein